MRRGKKRLTASQQRARRADRWASAVMIVVILGAGHSALQWWGDLAWFRLELGQPPLVWWAMTSQAIYWLLGAGLLWSVVVRILADGARDTDRHRWVWRWGGLAVVGVVCLSVSYLASRNGMAIYADKIIARPAILGPLETVTDAEVDAVIVRCEMVRRRRSVRPQDRIDRPMFFLALKDGRRLRVGGVRGGGIGGQPQPAWLVAMHRLSDFPRRIEGRSPECVDRVVARFPAGDQPFVRSLFRSDVEPPSEIRLCAPAVPGNPAAGGGCVVVPLAPGPPQPRPVPG